MAGASRAAILRLPPFNRSKHLVDRAVAAATNVVLSRMRMKGITQQQYTIFTGAIKLSRWGLRLLLQTDAESAQI